MADRNTVQNSGVTQMGSRSAGDETEGLTSLSSAGSGSPRGVNEAGSPIPTGYEGQSNGVRMPGPMSSGNYETWPFNDDGEDMSGVQSAPPYIQGVQLPGVPSFESGWNFGQDYAGLEQSQTIPPTNQDFGVLQGDLAGFDGDDSIGGRVVSGDIMQVFSLIVPDGGQGAVSQSGPVMGHDSMAGIVLGPGSGPYTGGSDPYQGGGVQDTYSTGPSPVSPAEYGSDRS